MAARASDGTVWVEVPMEGGFSDMFRIAFGSAPVVSAGGGRGADVDRQSRRTFGRCDDSITPIRRESRSTADRVYGVVDRTGREPYPASEAYQVDLASGRCAPQAATVSCQVEGEE